MSVETSIVIRTLNEAKNLEKLMKGIHEQNYRDWEIVLVDSGSSDGTLEIAERYGAHIYHIPKDEFTYGRSLNLGCCKAKGDYLVFVSGHVWPITNNWLRNLIKPFDEPSVAMVYGRQRGTDDSRLPEIRDLSIHFGTTSHILVDEPNGNNGNAAIRRRLWQDQPFDESLPGLEDVDWARKAERDDYRIFYAADAAVYHLHEETLGQLYRRHWREAAASKLMFPHYRFFWSDLVKGLPYFIARDLLYAFKFGMKRKFLGVPGARISQFFAIYNGVRYQKKLRQNTMRSLEVPESYRQVTLSAPGEHQMEQVDAPKLGHGEALVKVVYAGVAAADLDSVDSNSEGAYPRVPGREFSGIVVKTGSGVADLDHGDTVFGIQDGTAGAYCEYLAVQSQSLRKLPGDMPLKHAALAGPVAEALSGVAQMGAAPGASACVVGAGTMGNLIAQILYGRQLRVTAVDGHEKFSALLHKYEIDTLSELGPLDQYDFLVDTSQDPGILDRLIEGSKPSAKILSFGPVSSRPASHAGKLVYASGTASPEDWKQAVRLIQTGSLSLVDHISAIEPLEYYRRAAESMANSKHLKVLLSASRELESL